MKLAVIATYPPRGERHAEAGGVSSYTMNLVTSLPRTTSDGVCVLCEKLDGSYENYQEDGLQIYRVFDKKWKYVFQLFQTIKTIQPDVVHIQQELNLFGGPFTAYLLQWFVLILRRKTKVIITLHGVVDLQEVDKEFVRGNNSELPPFIVKHALKVIYTPLGRYAHKIIVHENKFKDMLVKGYRFRADKIVVVRHGVEGLQPIDKGLARNQLGLEQDKHVALFMGYLTGYKGLDILIEGFAKFAKTDPKAYLVIGAGKHPKLCLDSQYLGEYNRLVTKAKRLIPSQQYVWIGFIKENDISTYYSASDVSVYPYTVQIASSGPMAIAIGYGKPFLASDAFKGVFTDDFIFERSASALANALGAFFKSPNSLNAKVSALKQGLSWEVIGQATHRCYTSLSNKYYDNR